MTLIKALFVSGVTEASAVEIDMRLWCVFG